MRFVIIVLVLIGLAIAFKPVAAEQSSRQEELPTKLAETMAALPAKLELIDGRLGLIEIAKSEQDIRIDELEAKLASLSKVKTVPVVVKVVEPSKTIAVSSGYRNQWTYPGDIATHMATAHGISVAGKTKEQLEREHDAAHNANGVKHAAVTRSVTRYQPVTRSVSNCPGGVCPTGPSTTSRTFMRWR